MVRLILNELDAPAQLVTAHARQEADRPAIFAKGSRQEEGQPIDPQRLRCGAQGDAVPPQQAGDLQVTRRATESDEDKIVLQQLVDGLSP
jgi:hypothetical protein